MWLSQVKFRSDGRGEGPYRSKMNEKVSYSEAASQGRLSRSSANPPEQTSSGAQPPSSYGFSATARQNSNDSERCYSIDRRQEESSANRIETAFHSTRKHRRRHRSLQVVRHHQRDSCTPQRTRSTPQPRSYRRTRSRLADELKY